MNDDDDTRLRDQFAIAAMQALITRNGSYGNFIEKNEHTNEDGADSAAKLKRIAIIAYKIADAMRKARLQAFT